jgi:hypothetical protein
MHLSLPTFRSKIQHDRRFFLDLGLVLEDPDNDEIVFERTKKELDGLDRREVQYATRMLPCADMLTSERFHEWRDGLEDWLGEHEPQNLALFRSEWRKKWTRAVAQALDFEVPLVELAQVDESNDDSIGRSAELTRSTKTPLRR